MLVEDEFRRRYFKKMVTFTALFSFPSNNPFFEMDNEVVIRHTSIAERILKTFGPLIRKMTLKSISNGSNSLSVENIFKLIEEYCAKNLIELQLNSVEMNFFQNIRKPFENVKIVSLQGNIVDLESDHFKFCNFFPVMRSLSLRSVEVNNVSSLIMNYPRLEHLFINFNHYGNVKKSISESVAIKIIQKNPQIRSIGLSIVSPSLLKAVSDSLQCLERLELSEYRQGQSQTIDFHFESVKFFKISYCPVQSIPSNIIFSEMLEQLEVETSVNDDKYIELIERSKGLKRLKITGNEGFKNDEISRIATAKLNVMEIDMVCHWNVKDESIIELIKNNKSLNKLVLKRFRGNEIRMRMKMEFENNWTVDESGQDIILKRQVF